MQQYGHHSTVDEQVCVLRDLERTVIDRSVVALSSVYSLQYTVVYVPINCISCYYVATLVLVY